MFARTVWSDDVLAETIHDIIHHFELSSLKVIGTEGSENHKTLTEKLTENQKDIFFHRLHNQDEVSLCDTFIEYAFHDFCLQMTLFH